MALKRNFTNDEKFGLTEEEIKLGEKYLRKHKTAGAVHETEAMKLYEMFMVGCSFYEIQQQYPQYEIAQVILTASLRGWVKDREKMLGSLKDRVQAKVVKSVIEQVDFLTTMLSVSNAEHLKEMQEYIRDPEGKKKPELRIESIKDYKEICEALQKLVAGAQGKTGKSSAMFETLNPSIKVKQEEIETYDATTLIDAELGDG